MKFPDFRPRPPWWGPDLQTLRNVLRPPRPQWAAHTSRQLLLPLDDGTGDALSARLDEPTHASRGPLVVLIHGLGGDEASAYIDVSAACWLSRGLRVLRLNLRGAGASRAHCRFQYHAGRSEDLAAALRALSPRELRDGLFAVGYSLGGNMLLKFAAEYGREFPLTGVASVSAPIDLAAASRRFLDPRNRFYHRHMLSSLKSECFAGGLEVPEPEARAIRAARSILEFDETVVAPRNGFEGAEHYYAESHARRFLGDIRVPALLIYALDDPWIPSEAYTSFDWQRHPRLVPLLAPGGGHVGFHGSGPIPWHDECVGSFFETLA